MSVLVVTGTDTGVGKTVMTAALAAVIRASGQRVCVVKPAQTGVTADEVGDVEEVRRLAGPIATREFVRLPDPLAPAAAARAARTPMACVAEHARRLVTVAGDFDIVIVEGAGGVLVPFDAHGGTIADLAAHVQASGAAVQTIVVARAGLGTLNHSALTVEALRHRGLSCRGLVIGSWPAHPDAAMHHNLVDLPTVTGRPIIGKIPAAAAELDPAVFQARAGDWFSSEAVPPW